MSPPISKDWWLAAALTGAALPAAIAQQQPPAAGTTPAGVITTTEPGKAAVTRPFTVNAVRGQKIVTGPNETTHVLFPDQSAITVGPNSELTITAAEYDARTKNGSLGVDLARGLLRVVGGFVSKRNEFTVRTATATVGIRGGISLVGSNPQGTQATFLFGQQMSVTGGNGNTLNITRPGFGTSVGGNGGPTPPERIALPPPPPVPPPSPPPPPGSPPPPTAVGGGTLPPPSQGVNAFSPERLNTNRQQGNPTQNPPPPPPTLNQILGGQPAPGNQS